MTIEPESHAEIETPQPKTRRTPLQRLGCVVVLLVWLVMALIPCFAITLATQQEVIIPLGNAPTQQLRFWLVMNANQRGIGVANPSVMQANENALCVETTYNFHLWMGSAESGVSCDCYQCDAQDSAWRLMTTANSVCAPNIDHTE